MRVQSGKQTTHLLKESFTNWHMFQIPDYGGIHDTPGHTARTNLLVIQGVEDGS